MSVSRPGLMICDDEELPYYVLVRVRMSVSLCPHLLMYYRMFAVSSFVPKAQYGPFSKLIYPFSRREGGLVVRSLQSVILVSGLPTTNHHHSSSQILLKLGLQSSVVMRTAVS